MADEVSTVVTPDPTPLPAVAVLPEKTFTQSELERQLDDRLRREREKYKDYNDLKAASIELAKIKEAQLSETDKLNKRIADLETEKLQAETKVRAAELAAIRTQVGAKLQLPAELQDRLRGETLEDIEADARLLLAAIPKPAPVTTTDSTSGVNASTPTPGKTDEEIREEAARYGVNFDYLKNYYQSRVKK